MAELENINQTTNEKVVLPKNLEIEKQYLLTSFNSLRNSFHEDIKWWVNIEEWIRDTNIIPFLDNLTLKDQENGNNNLQKTFLSLFNKSAQSVWLLNTKETKIA